MKIRLLLAVIVLTLFCIVSCDSDEPIDQVDECTVSFYNGEDLYCITEAEIGTLVPEPTKPQNYGYDFVGWYDGEAAWNFSTHKAKCNMTLKARWRVNFKEMFYAFGDVEVELDSAGTYMKINADFYKEQGSLVDSSLAKIKEANSTLCLPDDLYQKMISTVSSDGVCEFSGQYVTVKWTNDLQNGLRVTYYRK